MPLRDGVVHLHIEQGSELWHTVRLGLLTGSRAEVIGAEGRGKADANGKKPASVGVAKLLTELSLEALIGKRVGKELQLPQLDMGREREPLAFARFEAENPGVMLQRSGFLHWKGKRVGCSLDGHIGDFDELISIKCREPLAHGEHIRTGVIPASARRQMAHELWVTGAERHHYVSFNPDFPRRLQYHAVTLTRAQLEVDAYVAAAEQFLAQLETEIRVLEQLAAEGAWQQAIEQGEVTHG